MQTLRSSRDHHYAMLPKKARARRDLQSRKRHPRYGLEQPAQAGDSKPKRGVI